jgi:hypothetical protein
MIQPVPGVNAVEGASAERDFIKHVYYTIVAHADDNGVAAGLKLLDINDFTGSLSNAQTQNALRELEQAGKIRVDEINRRNRQFYLLNVTHQERTEARHYYDRARLGVSQIRAKRADLQKAERAVQNGSLTESWNIPNVTIEFSEVTEVIKEGDDRKGRRWRCDVHISNVGLIRNCSFYEYPDQFRVFGPARPVNQERTQFRDWFTYDVYLGQLVARAFAERLARNELTVRTKAAS